MTGMLDKKVIVISGVGPGLGTTLAHRCANDGAELVLAVEFGPPGVPPTAALDSKTGKKTVVLSAAALAELDSLPRIGAYAIASRSAGLQDEQPRTDIKKPWAAISKRAGIEDVHIHDLRHTFASVGAGDGMSLLTIGKLLGHADAATTQRYAHLHVDPTRAAADAIAGKIAAAIGGK